MQSARVSSVVTANAAVLAEQPGRETDVLEQAFHDNDNTITAVSRLQPVSP